MLITGLKITSLLKAVNSSRQSKLFNFNNEQQQFFSWKQNFGRSIKRETFWLEIRHKDDEKHILNLQWILHNIETNQMCQGKTK